MAHQRIRFRLDLTAEEYLAYYQGRFQTIFTRALDGRTIQFPAGRLRRFVTRDGVHGLFELEFDEDHKFVALRRVADRA